MFHFRQQPSTFLQNFVHLRQSAAELLLSVQNFKMAAAAILGVSLFNILAFLHVGPQT